MPKLCIRGAELRSALLSQKEAVVSHRIKFACAPSPALMEHMAWKDFPDYIPGSKLAGEIIAKNIVITTDNSALTKQELQLSCDSIKDFEWSRKQEGDSTRVEIRFYVVTSQPGTGALVEEYKRNVGSSLGSLRMDCEEQTEMDLAPAKPEPQLALKDDQGQVVRKFETVEELNKAAGEPLGSIRSITGKTPHVGAVGRRSLGSGTLAEGLAKAEKATEAEVN